MLSSASCCTCRLRSRPAASLTTANRLPSTAVSFSLQHPKRQSGEYRLPSFSTLVTTHHFCQAAKAQQPGQLDILTCAPHPCSQPKLLCWQPQHDGADASLQQRLDLAQRQELQRQHLLPPSNAIVTSPQCTVSTGEQPQHVWQRNSYAQQQLPRSRDCQRLCLFPSRLASAM